MRRVIERLRSEDGFSLVELSVALILSAMIVGSLVTVFFSFAQNAGDATRNAQVQSEVRAVIARIVMDVRQADVVTANGEAIESLSANKLVVYSDRSDVPGPERIVYERSSCTAGSCELWVRRYAATAGGGPYWTFEATPFEQSFIMDGVLDDQPLFGGFEWVGSPATKMAISSCDGVVIQCDFPLVSIVLRARPSPTTQGASKALEVQEEVRIRNV